MRRSIAVLSTAAAVATFVIATAGSQTSAASPAARHTPQPKVASRAALSKYSGSLARARANAVSTFHAQGQRTSKITALAAEQHAAKNGTVRVAVSGATTAVRDAVEAAGGQALASYNGATSVIIAKNKLSALAAARGVTAIDAVHRPYEDAASEGVTASGAATWQGASNNGAGVKIAIVDAGFGNLANEVTAGHLAANQGDGTHLVNEGCGDTGGTQHGTAVAEIVHQMAPQAELFLFCVGDSIGFGAAVDAIVANGTISIGTSSLSFPLDSRGDGSGATDSAAFAVAKARRAGVLWFQSAGNYAVDHWSGTLVDKDADGLIDLHGGLPGDNFEDDLVDVQNGEDALVALQWDQWPTSNAQIALGAAGIQCLDMSCTAQEPINPDPFGHPTPVIVGHANGQDPTLDIELANTSGFDQIWDIVILQNGSFPAAHFDLTYFGINAISANACPTGNFPDCGTPAAAFSGSVAAPSNSPFAVAVGAHDVADSAHPSSVEFFSSQGPSIDGRVKPDITGYDDTSSFLPDFAGGFSGTSAAAPHAAGAAALVKGQNSTWDASQIQNFLQQRATSGSPSNPPLNSNGFGLLTLGNPATSALPTGGKYVPLGSPTRILDTRTTTGGHHAKLGGAQTLTLPISGLPVTATAVAINLTGVKAPTTTFLSAFPGGTAWPGTSNLNLTPTDPTAAVFAIVSLNALQSIAIRNNTGLVDVVVDELGYFDSATGSLFNPLASASRVLDTRTTNGGHHGKVPSGGTVTVDPAAPVGATAAIVNLTEVNSTTSSGYLSAAPTCSHSSSTLNYGTAARANMAVVGLDGTGKFCVFSSGTTDVIVDVIGFMGATGKTYIGLPAPRRIMDTRRGLGPVAVHAINSNTSDLVVGTGLGDIPFSATALFTGIVEATATATGFLQAFGGPTRPGGAASTLNFSAGRIVPNAAIVGIPATPTNLLGIYNNIGQTNVAVDLFGYFG